jgi:predicted membrane protein
VNGLNGKTALGVILVIIGGLIVLRIFGFTLGPIFGYLFPIILLGLGYVGLKNGKNWIGIILIAVGAIMLLAKLSGVIFLILAIAAIIFGISILKGRRKNVF